MKRKLIPVTLVLCAALAAAPLLTGCSGSSEKNGSASAPSSSSAEITENEDGSYSCEVYAMDTVMDLKAYGSHAKKALRDSSETIYDLDDELDVTNKNSDIYRLNHRETDTVKGNVAEVLKQSLKMAEATNGNFDPTIYPIVRAWGFTTGKYKVPSDSEISDLLTHVGWNKVTLSDGSEKGSSVVSFSDDKTELDTGGIGKGYTSDVLQKLMKKDGVDSAIVSLGGNVMAVGKKTDGSSWNVAIEDPFDSGQYAGTVQISDEFAITSGGYQRNFKKNGHTYIHIMDPSTGRPVENDLASVTIISKSGTQADALSTALYVMGLEKAEDFWRTSDLDFGVIFVTQDKKIYVTEDVADRFSTDYREYNIVNK